MRIRAILAVAAAVGVVFPGTPAYAQPSEQDRIYLATAHQANLAEIAAGQLARQKGTAPVIKELGDRLITDHTRLDDALRPVAQEFGVTLPAEPNDEQKAVAAQLQATAAGPEFDRLWIATQLSAHDRSMAAGRTEITSGSDAKVKKLATDAGPVIASHHEALTRASSQLGTPTPPVRVDGGIGGLAGGGNGPGALPVILGGVVGVLLVGAGLMLRRRGAGAVGRQ